jgi:hypothetical protein
MPVFRLKERIPSSPSNEVIPRVLFHRLEKEEQLKGTRPVHLHCPWSVVLKGTRPSSIWPAKRRRSAVGALDIQ